MKKVKHKRPQDESFPVGKLVKKSLRPLVLAYYNAARRADDIADAQNLTREEKLAQLAETARAFHNKEAEGQFVRLPIWASCSEWKIWPTRCFWIC